MSQCRSKAIIKQGKDDAQPEPLQYGCKVCQRQFGDLTGTVFAGHHQHQQDTQN
ncbi:MAG: hypothetical protein M8364_20860 [Methylobacter sp.]|uniref:hypothetical protein n=1 Tax=Methylobacter sp. TaxID=2051955 RepID=UPI0025885275|nr:hypothetical protein [Methylobacter sp.]MCL7423344.1 hypothetical protein [Methylobacter sp.]